MMGWLVKMVFDFFMAFGVIVFFSMFAVLAFFDGETLVISSRWFFAPPLIYAWLRGEFHHWPREKRQT